MVNQKSERYFRKTNETDTTGILDTKIDFTNIKRYRYSEVDMLVYKYNQDRTSVSMDPTKFGKSGVADSKQL